jgi:hypothetical protein
VVEALIQTRNQTTIIGGGEIKHKTRRMALLILIREIVVQDRPGKATRGVRGTNRILVTLPEVPVTTREEAAPVPILAGIVGDPVPDHLAPVQDLQVADIN